MGALRLHPARVAGLSPRAVSRAWSVFDIQLAIYALALVVIGLLMAFTNSGDAPLATGSVFTRALMWMAIAIIVFTLAAAFDYRWASTFSWLIYLVNIGLLLLTLAIGSGVGGVSRWVSIGPLQFQFSEMAKVFMALVLAAWVAGRPAKVESLSTIVGAVLLTAPPLALVLIQPDLGTSLVFAAILIGMLWMSGASMKWLALMAAAVIAMIPIAWTYLLRDYQKERLTSFLNPKPDITDSGYQLYQSQIAVGSGGWFGRGLTNGTQAQGDFLPVQSTDFVFSVLAEELGFIGAMVLFLLFILLLWRVLVAGWRSRDPFGTLFSAGVASMVVFQLFVNVGMVMGIMPITGIPLPFVTHGGASLVSIAIGLGILQSINIRQTRAEW